MSKPKIGFYWCASCGGCEEAVVDLAEGILPVVEAVEIVFWPVAFDFKRSDVEAMEDGEITAMFINGAIRTTEQEEMAHLLRAKSQLLIAFGSCSHMGGIPGLANLFERKSLLERVYFDVDTVENPDRTLPQTETVVNGSTLTLAGFADTVRTLDQVVPVDYYLPGCSPPVQLIVNAVTAILEGNLPPTGTVLAPDVALCDECPRKETKPEDLQLTAYRRPSELIVDPEKCLLAQELLCLGMATRSGCEAACISGNMPCTGCMGPTSRVSDFGAKVISALASSLKGEEPEEITAAMAQIPDPVGTFYRYSLPASLLHRRPPETGGAKE